LQALKDYHVEIYVSVDSADPHHFESIRMGAKFDQVIGRLKQIKQGFLVFTLQKTNYREIIDVGKLASMVDFGLIINVVHVEDSQYKIDFNKILDNDWLDIMNQFKSLHDIIPDDRLLIPDQIWGRLVPDEISTTISCDRLPICPNVTGEMMIAYDGTVFPCNMFNPTIYGNLLQQSFPEIWQSKQHEAFLTNHKQHPYCQYCEYMIPL
jgi:radical SAM protein with 4Fe4S-binding SPASM domain